MIDDKNMNLQVERQTTFSCEKRKKLVNWFAKQNVIVQIDIFTEQKNQYFALKNKFGVNDTTALSSYLIAIDKYNSMHVALSSKNKSLSIDKIKELSSYSVKKYHVVRLKEKRERLLNLFSVIKHLKRENYSYRQISSYLQTRHHFEVSHSYIQKIYKEIHHD